MCLEVADVACLDECLQIFFMTEKKNLKGVFANDRTWTSNWAGMDKKFQIPFSYFARTDINFDAFYMRVHDRQMAEQNSPSKTYVCPSNNEVFPPTWGTQKLSFFQIIQGKLTSSDSSILPK